MRLSRSFSRAASILVLLPLLAAGKGCGGDPERVAPTPAPLVLANATWVATPPMNDAHAYHTATLLLNDKVLIAGGQADLKTYLKTVELYDPAANTWAPAAPLASARSHHTATLLKTGKVLVTGGFSAGGAVATAEMYDPASDTWAKVSSMQFAREDHAATLLDDGTVLITGGYDGTKAIAVTAELFDGTSFQKIPGPQPRYKHTATRLGDGRVLVVGGYSDPGPPSTVLGSAEVYDPATKTWSPAGSLAIVRSLHTATLLSDGKVLVAGGETTNGIKQSSTELYDPNSNTWAMAAPLAAAREWHTATLIGNVKVLIADGLSNLVLNSAELYDPALKSWAGFTPTPMMNPTRYTHTATLLGDGRVLFAGGQDSGSSYLHTAVIYQPSPLGAPCTAPDDCVSGFCGNGSCCEPPCCALPEGTACDDGNKCTEGDKCQMGACLGAQKTCATPTSPCHDATCDQATGTCVVASSPKPKGSPCDDGDRCTTQDQCDMNGICTGATVECVAQDICHEAGTCDATTGLCDSPPKPTCDPPSTEPPKVPPSVVLCKSAKECKSGFCVDGVCCDSACDAPCHSCALLATAGKCTLEPKGVDLRHDCEVGFNCLSTCAGTEDGACIGAGSGTQCRPITCTDETHGVTAATCSMTGPTCPTGDTIPFNCWPFRCAAALGACLTTCSSVNDCAPSLVCDPTHHCVAPPPVANTRNLGGCALAPRPPGASLPGLYALLALAAAAARRRARHRLS